MRRIGIEIESERLRIEFPYDESLVQTVKTLPQRRWDPDAKAWYVPFDHVERVFETLLERHFTITPDLRTYCRENHRPVEEILEDEATTSAPAPAPPDTLTISELNLRAKEVLESAFDDSVWLVGELQGFDRAQEWRHAFFELVERPAEDADPVAKIQAVMFQGDRERIEGELEGAAEEIRLRDGLAVRVRGDVELYPKSGSYQIVVREVDPTYTSGEIQRNRQAILDRLEEKGIRDRNLERPWPKAPLRVGLITSYDSDAYNDFYEELRASGFGFEVTVCDAYMQGDRAEASILAALRYFEERADAFDVVVVVRGGGARSDLAYFDTDAIGEAVCRHPVKVVSGIGHQRDVSLLDHIAASQKTPTAAGRALVERVSEFAERLDDRIDRILEGARERLRSDRDHLERVSVELGHRVDRRLNQEDRRLSSLRSSLSHAARDRLEEAGQRVEGAARTLSQVSRSTFARKRQTLQFAARQLRFDRIGRRLQRRRDRVDDLADAVARRAEALLERERERIDRRAERLDLLDPQNVLERGYAIVRHDGEIVRAPREVAPDERLEVRLADGEIRVTVDDSEKEQG